MRQRNPFGVFILAFITFGIYGLVWFVKTKREMNDRGSNIPTAWLIIIPLVSIYWEWKYCEGVAKTTNNGLSTPIAFILLFLLGSIGMAVIQSEFNKIPAGGEPAVPATAPADPVAGSAPVTVTPGDTPPTPPSTPTVSA